MKVRQKLTGVALLLLVLGAAGLYFTSGSSPSVPSRKTASAAAEALSLNTRYLNTALELASRVAAPGEERAAQSTLDAADRDLDLQYAYDLQLASVEPVAETPEIQSIQKQIARIEDAIQTRQAEVDRLKSLVARVRGARQSALQEQLDVSQAELNLYQEALEDAKDSLDQAGGSLQGRLAQLKAEHTAASQGHDSFHFPAFAAATPPGSLLARWQRWDEARARGSEIEQARRQAEAGAASLRRQQQGLAQRIATEEAQRKILAKNELTSEQIAALAAAPQGQPARKAKARTARAAQAAPPAGNRPDSTIALIRRTASDRILLRILNRRIQAMDQVAAAYAQWGVVVAGTGRADLHSFVAIGLWVVVMMALAFLLNRLIEHFFAGLSLERRQKATLQAVLRISVRLIVVIVILMMVFGKPHNLSTVLGLAGAGLAVALQDFILSFLGWFVLMGRHGIRVGDLVEINPNSFSGVRGEVVEITLFRTVLLETGNWNEPGHLTGRQIAFMNMYAVNGYYFNFSTSGQWLWDELEVAIPRGENPYPIVDKIQAIVAGATKSHAELAEREWQRVSSRYGTRPFSAEPTVNIRPTESGVLAVVRYMIRADERSAMRYRLNREIVMLLHGGEEIVGEARAAADAEAPAPRRG